MAHRKKGTASACDEGKNLKQSKSVSILSSTGTQELAWAFLLVGPEADFGAFAFEVPLLGTTKPGRARFSCLVLCGRRAPSLVRMDPRSFFAIPCAILLRTRMQECLVAAISRSCLQPPGFCTRICQVSNPPAATRARNSRNHSGGGVTTTFAFSGCTP